MLEAVLAARPGEGFRPVAGPVVGHDALDHDAQAALVGDRRRQEGDSVGWELVHVCIDDASRIAFSQILPDAIAGDAVADALEAPAFLDVNVDHVTGRLALVAARRLGWFDIPQPRKTGPLEHAAYRRRRHAACLAMCWPVSRRRRNAAMSSATVAGVCAGLLFGRDERSAMPAPPTGNAPTQRTTIFAATP